MKINIQNQKLYLNGASNLNIYIKRIDKIHPKISGNKYYKLKYNFIFAKSRGYKGIITFGGAASNHIAALSYLGLISKMPTAGIIRGEELSCIAHKIPTLRYARKCAMKLIFVHREIYKDYTQRGAPLEMADFKDWYILPEGGTNDLAIKGCEEILSSDDAKFDIICVPVGTGGTIAGVVNSSYSHHRVYGFCALKGDFLSHQIKIWSKKDNWKLFSEDTFGGYAKMDNNLISFINNFFQSTKVPLEPIYTGKMFYKIIELYKKGYFSPSDKILAIHTGGLQGILSANYLLKSKGKETINFH